MLIPLADEAVVLSWPVPSLSLIELASNSTCIQISEQEF